MSDQTRECISYWKCSVNATVPISNNGHCSIQAENSVWSPRWTAVCIYVSACVYKSWIEVITYEKHSIFSTLGLCGTHSRHVVHNLPLEVWTTEVWNLTCKVCKKRNVSCISFALFYLKDMVVMPRKVCEILANWSIVLSGVLWCKLMPQLHFSKENTYF